MNGETLTKAHAEALIQALTGGQTPEPGQTLVWEDDIGWTFGGAPSYAGIRVDGNAVATAITVSEVYTKFTGFDTNMPESRANGDHTTDSITVGDTGPHVVLFFMEGESAGVNKIFEPDVFEIEAETKVITGITDADPAVVTSANHKLNGGERIKIAGVLGMVEVNNQLFKVVRIDKDTFSLDAEDDTDVDATGYTAYTSGGTIQITNRVWAHSDHSWAGGALIESVPGGVLNSLTLDNTLEYYLLNATDATDFTVEGVSLLMFKVS